jgi:taurine dioxygenase
MKDTAKFEAIGVNPLTPHLGAEITDIDLSKPLNDTEFNEIHQAFLDWSVLVFRDQHLDRDAHKAFGRRFGALHVHPMQHSYGGDPEILTVKTTAESRYTAGDGWHTDVTCDEIPPLGSMLYITQTPESGGGDTLFADMYLAYELLSESMQNMLEGLTAIHDGAIPYLGSYGVRPPEGQNYPQSEHPVVVTHPETGRKLLYVNSGFTSHIKGLHRWESRLLLDGLFKHIASTPKLVCRVQWQPNTLTFWDNRCTQHHAVWDYYPETRYGERVSIIGDARPSAQVG